jgi:hypothetical protein
VQSAGLRLLLSLTGMLLVLPAYADCGADALAMQSRLASGANSKARDEARLLAEKARIDAQHGREQMCVDALQRAAKLTR